jgi:hypothetical protein
VKINLNRPTSFRPSHSVLKLRTRERASNFLSTFREMGPVFKMDRKCPEARALNSQAEILLFGGAAGSLKTETLLIDAVREADNPNLNAIIFRES